ncbi:MAG: hydrogenase formation protein HypD [Candidatus Omnitrophica bacterium]|nr:hydrogenase formation protein HypD [Candidatus Omnitrophota bacterium]
MRYVDEFRNRKLIDKIARLIREKMAGRAEYKIMEVCGTHTMAIARWGLRQILPDNVKLISGPGCPVCVTPKKYIDKAVALSRMPEVTIATFGDMLRVPGSYSSLDKERSAGASVKLVYSTDDALDIARKYPRRQVVFLGIGFETTAPTVAASILEAKKEGLKNYSVLCGHKTMPEALKKLVVDNRTRIDGFLLPGHVSAIIGSLPYEILAEEYSKSCVVGGFEPVDILESIFMLISQKKPKVEIEYSRITHPSGNSTARRVMERVFVKADSVWRGIGKVRSSGLRIRKDFSDFDADIRFSPNIRPVREDARCICGDVLKGVKVPPQCALFGRSCTPEHPVGACMVSSEGTCAAYYKYGV